MRRVGMNRSIGLWALLLTGCAQHLVVQDTLAARVHRSTLACVAAPAGPPGAKTCAAAALCQAASKSAVDSLQAVQVATASGNTDVAAETKAAGLTALADIACKRGGW